MFFSKIVFNPSASANHSYWNSFADEYATHQMIWMLFSTAPDMKRDFLYRKDMEQKCPVIYAVSPLPPRDSSTLWNINTKVYAPVIRQGQTFSFLLRANPVVSKRDQNDKQHRHDVVMDAKKRITIEPDREPPSMSDIIRDAGLAWLQKKANSHGFDFDYDDVRTEGYHQNKFCKPNNGQRVSISTLDFTGSLTVTDAETFIDSLFHGIGPAKSFGCGMLMIQRKSGA